MNVYVMKNCGCRIVEKDLAFDKRGCRRCPEHIKNSVEYVEKKCPDCGIHVLDMKSPFAKIRCETCKKKHTKERMRIYDMHRVRNVKKSAKVIKHIQAIEEQHKFDVSLYAQGLSKYLPKKGNVSS